MIIAVVVFVVLIVVFAVVGHKIVVFVKNNTNLRYRIVSVSSPRMAAQYPFCREVKPLEQSVFPERFKSILRACRRESACGRSERGYACLIEPYQKYEREYQRFPCKYLYLTFLLLHFR